MKTRGSRTPLFSILRKLTVAAATDEVNKISDRSTISRRQFLKGVGATAGLVSLGIPSLDIKGKNAPKITIIGGGIAGLNAAYTLKKAGVIAQVYEGSSRLGGRILTAKNILGQRLTTELGGEFIDSNHAEMISLAQEFGLELKDRKLSNLIPRAFYFGGSLRSEKQVIEGIKPFANQILKDNKDAALLDNISVSEYFQRLEISGWIKDLLETAYVTEYGLEISEQSTLNFLTMFSVDFSNGFEIFGESDERYTIADGNSKIIDELAARLDNQISIAHRLESVSTKGKGYELTFANNESTKTVSADIVLLTIPFSVLRTIEMNVELPDWKLRAIKELGYGDHTKVTTGFTKRIWKESGYSGEVFSDEDFQLCWDNTETQAGEPGGLTSFTGGKHALNASKGSVKEQSEKFIQSLEKIFPGISKTSNQHHERFAWSSNPFTMGSYSSYKPGQWTTIRGLEIKPVSNLFFAGEHCSLDYQGFMNGAAETGKNAAKAIINLLK